MAAKAEKKVAEVESMPIVHSKFKLPNKKVTVKPIIKPTAMIPDVNHRAAFLAPNAKYRIIVPTLRNGTYKNPLTNEEKEFYENEEWGLGYGRNTLSVLKKEDNYWDNFEVFLGKEMLTLDLSNPEDYLKYKVLLASSDLIAASHRDVKDKFKATYKFYLEHEEDVIEDKAESANITATAWKHYFELVKDRGRMFNMLAIYGKRPSNDVSDDFLSSEIASIIERGKTYAKEFVAYCEDPDFDLRVLFRNATRQGIIIKRNNQFLTTDGEFLGRTEEQVLKFIKEPVNQELILKIESRVK